MTGINLNNNKYVPQVPKTYEQFVLEEQQLTPEQQQDLYPELEHEDISEQNGYGPGDGVKGQHLIKSFNNEWGETYDLWDEEISGYSDSDGFKTVTNSTSASISTGVGGVLASGGISHTSHSISGDFNSGETKFGHYSLKAEAGAGLGGATAKVRAGIDVINATANTDAGKVNARIGINADTGGSVGPGGVEAKFLGFGVSLGKKTGFSTPLGELSFEFDD